MKHFYFLRHGQSEFNATGTTWSGSSDTPLTALGQEQAKKAGEDAHHNGLRFDLIISSPLQRARHTAELFAEQVHYPINKILIDDNTVERNFGSLEGIMNASIKSRYQVNEGAIDDYESVEKVADLQSRADDYWGYIQSLNHDIILLVGHGAFGRALLRSINAEPIVPKKYIFNNAELLKFV